MVLGSTLVPPVMHPAMPLVVVVEWNSLVTAVLAAVIAEGVLQAFRLFFGRITK
jgi:hypothetical protein